MCACEGLAGKLILKDMIWKAISEFLENEEFKNAVIKTLQKHI